MNHLEYYKECLETGYLKGKTDNWGGLHRNGLCYEPEIDKDLLEMFEPTKENCLEYHVSEMSWWAADKQVYIDSHFGPTRQNIVLFIAAMRGEL